MPDPKRSQRYAEIFAVVRQIPRGRVATYGQIATLAGIPRHARQVGYALHALGRMSRVPWHRVINRQGRISARSMPGPEILQRTRLEKEGVIFDAGGRVNLARFLWDPGGRKPSTGSLRCPRARRQSR